MRSGVYLENFLFSLDELFIRVILVQALAIRREHVLAKLEHTSFHLLEAYLQENSSEFVDGTLVEEFIICEKFEVVHRYFVL